LNYYLPVHNAGEVRFLRLDRREGQGFSGFDTEFRVVPRAGNFAIFDFTVTERSVTVTAGIVDDEIFTLDVKNSQRRAIVKLDEL
jgi:hypothetical protein